MEDQTIRRKRGRKCKEESHLNKKISTVDHDEHSVLKLGIQMDEIIAIPSAKNREEQILSEQPQTILAFGELKDEFDKLSIQPFKGFNELQNFTKENICIDDNTKMVTGEFEEGPSDHVLHSYGSAQTENYETTEVYDSRIFPKELNIQNEIKGKRPLKVDICCWWCAHNFDTCPVYTPYKYDDRIEIFKVKGIFCSFNCAGSYSKSNGFDTGLIKLMRKMLSNVPMIKELKYAPSRETLKCFGGILTIEEYRESFSNLDSYDFTCLPITHVIHQIKVTKIRSLKQKEEKTVFLTKNKVETANNRLKTKRESGISKNFATLDQIMGISFEN